MRSSYIKNNFFVGLGLREGLCLRSVSSERTLSARRNVTLPPSFPGIEITGRMDVFLRGSLLCLGAAALWEVEGMDACVCLRAKQRASELSIKQHWELVQKLTNLEAVTFFGGTYTRCHFKRFEKFVSKLVLI